MAKKAFYAHIVPRVYQKKWRSLVGPENVYYFEKRDLSTGVSGNVNKHMGVDEYYFLNSTEEIYVQLIDYKEIENYLDNHFENNWNELFNLYNSFLEYYKKSPNEKVQGISKKYLSRYMDLVDSLKDFVLMQHFRRFEHAKEYIIESIENYLPIIYEKRKIDDEDKKKIIREEFLTPNYLSAIWKKSLVDYKNFNKDINLILLNKQAMEDYTTVLIFSYGINRYILSDNPVIFNFLVSANNNRRIILP